MLKFDHLALRRGGQLLLEEAHFTIHPGHKVGISGANGCGKSSLLALVRGELHADAGRFTMPPGWTIASVAQETPAVETPALDYVLAGDAELAQLRSDLEQAERRGEGALLAQLHARLEILDGYSAESRAARLMSGLGFASTELRAPVANLSGGWRMRLNLARALMCRSDLLLLDEPTNHLDLDAVIWLEEWLRHYQGTLLLIAHDREFLDAVVEEIIYIEQHHATLYRGGYSVCERQRAERLAQQQAAYVRQQRVITHVHGFVERFRAKATKARQAQSRLKALERMALIAPAHVDSPFQFGFSPAERLPNPLLHLDAVSVGYGEQLVLQGVTLSLTPGDRIGLLGPNGAGKSTLIRLLAGDLIPSAGRVEPAQYLNRAYFAQHRLEQLRLDASPLWHLQRQAPTAPEQALRDFLGGFGFRGERVQEPTGLFSGGEKARLVLALLVYRRPNLLLLDEPTNHLDLEMRLALSQALQEYDGAVVLVSHDRHLLRVSVDRLLLVHGGMVQEFDDDLDAYPGWLARCRSAIEGADRDTAVAAHSATARKDRRRQDAEQRRRLQPLRERLRRLEDDLERLHVRQQALQDELGRPALYEEEAKGELLRLLNDQRTLDQELSQVENAWLEVSEALEQGEG